MKNFDLRDVALVIGVVSIIGGIAHFSVAIAAIVFGGMCLAIAVRPGPQSSLKIPVPRGPRITERQS